MKQKSDVYSFGMTLYEIFTGDVPWKGIEDGEAIVKAVISGQRPSISHQVPGKEFLFFY